MYSKLSIPEEWNQQRRCQRERYAQQ